MAPKVLIGHSLGGAAVLAAAASIPEAVAVVTIGAPFEPGHATHVLDPARLEQARVEGRARSSWPGVPST
jgi:putative redox protein